MSTNTLHERCVYTVLLGDYEELNEQPVAAKSQIDFLCFTDNRQIASRTWKIVYVDPVFPLDPSRSSRLYKICAHRFLKDYAASLYIDNTVILKQPPEKIFADLARDSADLICVYDSGSDILLDEFYEVVALELDDPNRVMEQLNAYAWVCPEILEQKPYWGGFIIRNHHKQQVIAAMETWLAQVFRYSRRDQLSLNYALQSHGMSARGLEWDNLGSDYHSWPIARSRKVKDSRRMALWSTTSQLLLRRAAEAELVRVQSELYQKDLLLQQITHSRAWRYAQPFRRVWAQIKAAIGKG